MPKANPPARKTPAPVDLNEVRELLAENAKAIVEMRKANVEARAEHDRETAEARKRQAKIDEQLAALGERADKAIAAGDRAIAAGDRAIANADKALAVAEKNNEYFGSHVRNEGELLEMQCYNTLKKNREINGIKLDDFHWGRKSAKYAVEVDIIGFNGKVVMPIEVKRTLSADDVRRFAEVRVGRFEKAFPQYAAGKQTIPVIIFAMPRTGEDEDPVKLALELGLTVLQSVGESQLSTITDPAQVISRTYKD